MGINSCGSDGEVRAFLTLDMTAIGDGTNLEVGANTITSDLPDYKPDIDSWSNLSWDNNESEVTVLGRVIAGENYHMNTYWDDYRDGGSWEILVYILMH